MRRSQTHFFSNLLIRSDEAVSNQPDPRIPNLLGAYREGGGGILPLFGFLGDIPSPQAGLRKTLLMYYLRSGSQISGGGQEGKLKIAQKGLKPISTDI